MIINIYEILNRLVILKSLKCRLKKINTITNILLHFGTLYLLKINYTMINIIKNFLFEHDFRKICFFTLCQQKNKLFNRLISIIFSFYTI